MSLERKGRARWLPFGVGALFCGLLRMDSQEQMVLLVLCPSPCLPEIQGHIAVEACGHGRACTAGFLHGVPTITQTDEH